MVLFGRGLARTLLDKLQGNSKTITKKAGVEAGNEAIGSLYTLNKRNTNSNSVYDYYPLRINVYQVMGIWLAHSRYLIRSIGRRGYYLFHHAILCSLILFESGYLFESSIY